MAENTKRRKSDHINICLEQKSQAKAITTGLEDVRLIHRALPEVDRESIDLATKVFDHAFAAPIIVGAMTGGTPEATKINSTIAEAVEKLGLGMGLGSQRAALEDEKLEKTFSIARKKAPTAFLVANIGGIQLVKGYGVKEIRKAIEMIEADAVAIHLNALQETIQPEGQTSFKGIITRIGEIAGAIDQPVIVKETGAGISAEDAKELESAGVKGIDVGGAGGTSFAAVEYYRASKEDNNQRFLGEAFWDWGIPTIVSLVEVTKSVKLPVIASGGLRSSVDIAKALSLNACLASLSQPILSVAVKSAKDTEKSLSCLIEGLRNVMFLVGAQKTSDLTEVPVVITGKTAEWLKTRNFQVEDYATRGQRGTGNS